MATRKRKRSEKTRWQKLRAVSEQVVQLYHLTWLRKMIMLLVLALLVFMALQTLLHSERLQVKRVIFNGNFQYLSQDAMKASVQHDVVGDLITIDLDRIYQDVMALPWVEDASIRRRWPGELVITVVEKKPLATWNRDQLLSTRGVVFTPPSLQGLPPLPALAGPEGSHAEVLAEYNTVRNQLDTLGLQVTRLSQDERESWQLEVKDGFSLRLGRKAIDERLQRFVDLYPKYFEKQKNRIRYFDMRYSNGLAIAWQEENA